MRPFLSCARIARLQRNPLVRDDDLLLWELPERFNDLRIRMACGNNFLRKAGEQS